MTDALSGMSDSSSNIRQKRLADEGANKKLALQKAQAEIRTTEDNITILNRKQKEQEVQIAKLKSELATAERDFKKTKSIPSRGPSSTKDAETRIQDISREIGQLRKRTEEQIRDKKLEIDQLNLRIRSLNKEIDELQRHTENLIKTKEMESKQADVKLKNLQAQEKTSNLESSKLQSRVESLKSQISKLEAECQARTRLIVSLEFKLRNLKK